MKYFMIKVVAGSVSLEILPGENLEIEALELNFSARQDIGSASPCLRSWEYSEMAKISQLTPLFFLAIYSI
jgi:hypothetical protein